MEKIRLYDKRRPVELTNRKLLQAAAAQLIAILHSPKGNLKLQAQLIHIAVILERAVEDGEEELAVVFHILQFEVFHNDGFGAVVVADNFESTALGNVACLRLESPKVAVQSDVYTWEDG